MIRRMFKKPTKVIVVVALMLMLMTPTVGASIPKDSVIIGDKAFSISYLMISENLAEINQALADAGLVPIYYQLTGMNDVFTDVFSNLPISAQELANLPQITYKNSLGNITHYAKGNGEPIVTTEEFKVVAIW